MIKPAARLNSGRYVSRLTSGTMAIIMAGGRGERLKELTVGRAKPAAPFGGKFRIIDFVLSNCVNSGIRQIAVMTQYKAQSLIQHVNRGWGYLRGEFGEFVDVVPAQQQVGEHWYRGTADCVYQNLDYIRATRPKHVLVLAGDHIYKMDYGPLIAYHVEKNADITIGVVEVPVQDAREFGVLTVTEWNKVVKFAEKPANPDPIPGRDGTALASMGIYVFNASLLERMLTEDAANANSQHDFGKNIIPGAIDNLQVFAYPFQDVKTRAQSYWRDVGTLDAYYDANVELVDVDPELNIYDEQWPIWTYQVQQPPAKFTSTPEGARGLIENSMISGGCIITGAQVTRSMLFSDVRVHEGAVVDRSVILPHVEIGRGCVVRNAIIDEGVALPDGMRIGLDRELDAQRFRVTERGVVLVTADMLRDA
jgi:glucose-1-phosphate adenylyltransferase